MYPDTYNINIKHFGLKNFVKQQLDTFKLKVYDKLLTNYSSKEIVDIINLASIVEKEEKNEKEKAIVA